MKKLFSLSLILMMLGMSIPAMGAMSINKMRQNARFLTDRMAYELHLSTIQYDDVYEVNYDFINSVRYIMDDVVRGNDYAIERYYSYLNYRNEDLRWILSDSQYRRFIDVEYFYRPIYTTSRNWAFRIYNVYVDVNHFYFGKPHHYKTYNGNHSRSHYHAGYYKHHHGGRYNHEPYKGHVDVHPAPKPSPMNGNRRPANVEQQKNNKNRPSANVAKPSEKKPAMGKRKYEPKRQGVSVKNTRKESQSSVKSTGTGKAPKRTTNNKGNNGQKEEGRRASRSR